MSLFSSRKCYIHNTNQPTSSWKNSAKFFCQHNFSKALMPGQPHFTGKTVRPVSTCEAFWDRLMACKSTGSPAIQPAAHLGGEESIHPNPSHSGNDHEFFGGPPDGAFLAKSFLRKKGVQTVLKNKTILSQAIIFVIEFCFSKAFFWTKLPLRYLIHWLFQKKKVG